MRLCLVGHWVPITHTRALVSLRCQSQSSVLGPLSKLPLPGIRIYASLLQSPAQCLSAETLTHAPHADGWTPLTALTCCTAEVHAGEGICAMKSADAHTHVQRQRGEYRKQNMAKMMGAILRWFLTCLGAPRIRYFKGTCRPHLHTTCHASGAGPSGVPGVPPSLVLNFTAE